MSMKSVLNLIVLSLIRTPRLRLSCPPRWILKVYVRLTHMEIIIVLNVLNFNVLILKAIGLLEAIKFSITFTTICSSIFIIFFLHKWVSCLSCLWINKHTRLWLKVFNLKIRSQNIFCQLLLKFFFNFLPKSLMDQLILRI